MAVYVDSCSLVLNQNHVLLDMTSNHNSQKSFTFLDPFQPYGNEVRSEGTDGSFPTVDETLDTSSDILSVFSKALERVTISLAFSYPVYTITSQCHCDSYYRRSY